MNYFKNYNNIYCNITIYVILQYILQRDTIILRDIVNHCVNIEKQNMKQYKKNT